MGYLLSLAHFLVEVDIQIVSREEKHSLPVISCQNPLQRVWAKTLFYYNGGLTVCAWAEREWNWVVSPASPLQKNQQHIQNFISASITYAYFSKLNNTLYSDLS